jgi:hypothetical protein
MHYATDRSYDPGAAASVALAAVDAVVDGVIAGAVVGCIYNLLADSRVSRIPQILGSR